MKKFWQEVLLLPYKSNSQDNPDHEEQVKELIEKHGFKYDYQPNGTHQSPDFRIYYKGKTYDVECKSVKRKSRQAPVYNGGLAKKGVIYIFSSEKYHQTTVFFGDDVVTDIKRTLYDEFLEKQNALLQEYRSMPEWQEDDRGFDFYCRAMYTQSGGQDKTDYFIHKNRAYCEDRVVNYVFGG